MQKKWNKESIMMKKNILLFLISFLFFTATHAEKQESNNEIPFCVDQTNFYAKFLSGAHFLQNTITDGNKSTFKTGYIITGSLGYQWSCGLRLEAEYAFRRNAIKKI